jgi:hypothetical protein
MALGRQMERTNIMKAFLIASAALALTVAHPASAQLLGSGSLGGSLGGALGGQPGGPIGGPIGGMGSLGGTGGLTGTAGRLGSATDGTLTGSARSDGSQKVDHKSGTVSADRSASGSANGSLGQTLTGPERQASASASGGGSGSGGASGSATLLGTDDVREGVAGARSTAGGLAGKGRDGASTVTQRAARLASTGSATAQGTGNAAGSGSGAASRNGLATAGNATGGAAGALDARPGTPVLSPGGRRIGEVRDVTRDSNGRVRAMLVDVDGRQATLPAANFSGDGNGVVSAMGKGEIKKAAGKQGEAGPDGSTAG